MNKLIKNIERSSYIDEIKSLRRNKNRPAINNFNSDLIKPFGPDYLNKADKEQPDTTDMPGLESEECSEQRNQEGQRIKIIDSKSKA